MKIIINESGMQFGPYAEDCCFHIEKSSLYQRIQDNVLMAEFLFLREKPDRDIVFVIEAKSSSPRQESSTFDDYIESIREKLTNGLTLYLAARLSRHPNAQVQMSALFQNLDLSKTDFRLLLIINGHQEGWLPPLHDALREALRSTVKVWGLSATSVAVLNDDMARKMGLIQ